MDSYPSAMDANSYLKGQRNTVNRASKRAAYSYETVHGIINDASVVHVSFLPPSPSGTYDDPQDRMPVVLPMVGKIGMYPQGDDDGPVCYLHGHPSSRLVKLSPTVSAVDKGESDGLPVCIAATHVDGYLLALTPFMHSYNYRSAVLHGTASVVQDLDETLFAIKLITDSVVPDRWDSVRSPPTGAELQSTRVLRVRIVSGSAKIKAERPHDDKADMQNKELVQRVWTGVVPVFEGLGEPVPDDIRDYLRQENVRRKNYAIRAAKGDEGVGVLVVDG